MNTEKHVPSGYNAAVIIACNGDIDGALYLLDEVRSMVNNSEVNKLYVNLLNLKKKNEAVAEQYSGSANTATNITTSPYEFLLN